jgi:hypothetical protein
MVNIYLGELLLNFWNIWLLYLFDILRIVSMATTVFTSFVVGGLLLLDDQGYWLLHFLISLKFLDRHRHVNHLVLLRLRSLLKNYWILKLWVKIVRS